MPDADETTTSATAADEVEARLVADLEAARANVQRLQEEYDQLLADPAVIQEDKDSHRILLERAKDAYGRCSRCGAEIPPERLEALPEADTCVNCS